MNSQITDSTFINNRALLFAGAIALDTAGATKINTATDLVDPETTEIYAALTQDYAAETQDSAAETQDSTAETQYSAAKTQDSAAETQYTAAETQSAAELISGIKAETSDNFHPILYSNKSIYNSPAAT